MRFPALRYVSALMLLALLLALPAAAEPEAGTVHYRWKTIGSSAAANYEALPCNVTYDAEAGVPRTKAYQINSGWYYGENGRVKLLSYYLANGVGHYTNADTGADGYYGLPYRVVNAASESAVITETLWFELGDMAPLDTAGLGAANVALDYVYAYNTASTPVAFLRCLEVYVSLDGASFLPDCARVRSVKLLGGGMNTKGGSPILVYRLQSEDLLSIPGVSAGDVIRRIRIRPTGVYARSSGNFTMSALSVTTFPTEESFEQAVPRDEPELIELGEETMRAIPVAEGIRTASIPWRTEQWFYTTFPGSQGQTVKCSYSANIEHRGPTYERDIDSSRELFASSIVDGVYGFNGAGFSPDENGKNGAHGMDCQTFVFNAISRVSRTWAWAVLNTFGDPYTRLLGGLDTADMPFFSDIDVVSRNTAQQMYESYALAQCGDIALHRLVAGGVHTRVVKRVEVVRDAAGAIDPEQSWMICTEQASLPKDVTYLGETYRSSSRPDSRHSFASLYADSYVVFTLTDYAAGKVEKENVQMIAAPLSEDRDYTGGVCFAVSSNYRIIKYDVALRDMDRGIDLFTDGAYVKGTNHRMAISYESDGLNAILADLPDGSYRLSVRVHSGPLTSTEQEDVPVTRRDFDFEVKTAVAGDLTGDGKVNGKDVTLLQRHVAGGYGVTLDVGAGDLTGDGKVNGKDVTLLQRFVAGGYGVTL